MTPLAFFPAPGNHSLQYLVGLVDWVGLVGLVGSGGWLLACFLACVRWLAVVGWLDGWVGWLGSFDGWVVSMVGWSMRWLVGGWVCGLVGWLDDVVARSRFSQACTGTAPETVVILAAFLRLLVARAFRSVSKTHAYLRAY